jgi:hypothetical protein
MMLDDFFQNGHVTIWNETFAVMKSKKAYPNAFANIIDKTETTVILEETRVQDNDVIDIERDWKILTFDMCLLFGLVGFLARVARVLADKGIPIVTISAYSTDHILVKKRDLAQAKATLENLGCIVTT